MLLLVVTVIVDRCVAASFLACDYKRGQAGVMLRGQLPVDRHACQRFFDNKKVVLLVTPLCRVLLESRRFLET